jgi:prolyl-tRNA editing enzyme YbaK/EbsC (Cys-tRNA(Pro) deacylase)
MPTIPLQPLEPKHLRGFDAVRRSLDDRGVTYEVLFHECNGAAMTGAPAGATPARRVIKAVAVRANGRLVTVALPASERVGIQSVQQLLGDPGARLATEAELARELPGLDPGALPPFGPPAPPVALVDRRVLSCNWVLANGGDDRHSLRVSPLEIVRVSQARVVDIAEG